MSHFRENLQTDRADRVDGQTLFHRTLLSTRENTKKFHTLQELLVGGNRHDAGGTGSHMC